MRTSVGIYSMPADVYHADTVGDRPSLSASIAKILVTKSPLHAWAAHPRLNPDYVMKHEAKFDPGTAAHTVLLRDERAVQIVVASDWKTDLAQLERDVARAAGKIPILAKQWHEVQRMVEAARVQLDGTRADPRPFTDGKAEQTMVWEDNGVLCRALVDWLRDDRQAIDDYKTTKASANPEQWTRTLYGIGADIQVAFYLRGCQALGWPAPEFRFVVQETYPPYALSVIGLDPPSLELADSKVEYALGLWKEALNSGVFPGYPLDVAYAELPGYEEARWLEKEARESV